MSTTYPELARSYGRGIGKLKHEIPEAMAGFAALHTGSLAEGELSTKTKELIAVAMGIGSRCEGCIALHIKAALKAGASRQELIETIGVAVLMGGGPALIYATEALEAIEQFEAIRKPEGSNADDRLSKSSA